MIDVLPSNSLLSFCKNNVTVAEPSYQRIYQNITKVDLLNSARSIESMFDVSHGVIFNCYYSVWTAVDPSTYSGVFGGVTVLLNILFNLGYMYTDVKNIMAMTLTTNSQDYWRKFGKYAGDITMRIFYRKPIGRGGL